MNLIDGDVAENGWLVARPRYDDGDPLLVVLWPRVSVERRHCPAKYCRQTPNERDGPRRSSRTPRDWGRWQLSVRHLLLLWSDDPHQPAHCYHVGVVSQRHWQLGHWVEVCSSPGSVSRTNGCNKLIDWLMNWYHSVYLLLTFVCFILISSTDSLSVVFINVMLLPRDAA